jgi:hypothetical protein
MEHCPSLKLLSLKDLKWMKITAMCLAPIHGQIEKSLVTASLRSAGALLWQRSLDAIRGPASLISVMIFCLWMGCAEQSSEELDTAAFATRGVAPVSVILQQPDDLDRQVLAIASSSKPGS